MSKDKNETHHHWHGGDIFLKELGIFFLIVILLVSGLRIIEESNKRFEIVYKNCVDACSQKHFSGVKVGLDGESGSSYVNEFDRTDCIDSCNQLYLKVNGG